MIIDTTTILAAEIRIDDQVRVGEIDLGAVTLKKDDREFILDIVMSEWHRDHTGTTITCKLEQDKESFPDCKYDLTSEDLRNGLDTATIFAEQTDKSNITVASDEIIRTLWCKSGSLTYAIDLKEEV